MKKNYLKEHWKGIPVVIRVFAVIFFLLIVFLVCSYFKQPFGSLYKSLLQIVSCYMAGFIALIGVVLTLNKQRELSDKEWTRQLELSREEWKRQNEQYREEWRIKVQPWFDFIGSANSCNELTFRKFKSNDLYKNVKNEDDLIISIDRFSIKNSGKDYAFLKNIVIKCPRGAGYIIPDKQLRVTSDMPLKLNIETKFILQAQENYRLFLEFNDMFDNTYISEMSTSLNNKFQNIIAAGQEMKIVTVNGIDNPTHVRQE